MKIKILALLLTSSLLLGMLSGCGAEAEVSEPVEISGDLTVLFPKLGAADAAILMTENATVIIDSGEDNDGDELLKLLSAYGRSTVDLLLISHYDKDHIGGVPELLSGVEIKRVIGSTSPKDSDEMTAYQKALSAAGLKEETPREETIVLDGMVLELDIPDTRSYKDDQSNNSSVIVSVTYGDTTLCFGGDAMAERLAEIQWPEKTFDLIKIPHHGREAEYLNTYLGAMKDGAYAIITSSNKEPESDELVQALKDAGMQPYLTKEGDVRVVSDGTRLTLEQTPA